MGIAKRNSVRHRRAGYKQWSNERKHAYDTLTILTTQSVLSIKHVENEEERAKLMQHIEQRVAVSNKETARWRLALRGICC